jgi:hypothetical protein
MGKFEMLCHALIQIARSNAAKRLTFGLRHFACGFASWRTAKTA